MGPLQKKYPYTDMGYSPLRKEDFLVLVLITVNSRLAEPQPLFIKANVSIATPDYYMVEQLNAQ